MADGDGNETDGTDSGSVNHFLLPNSWVGWAKIIFKVIAWLIYYLLVVISLVGFIISSALVLTNKIKNRDFQQNQNEEIENLIKSCSIVTRFISRKNLEAATALSEFDFDFKKHKNQFEEQLEEIRSLKNIQYLVCPNINQTVFENTSEETKTEWADSILSNSNHYISNLGNFISINLYGNKTTNGLITIVDYHIKIIQLWMLFSSFLILVYLIILTMATSNLHYSIPKFLGLMLLLLVEIVVLLLVI
ncbi:putative membrane protein [Wickerhamomyces ciferrii]|uniref:Membrane protein n=1 Tax=Wickerhamomyces ciferrii (strain ATCC 14091 / BCRC 22168 / CBS 111 / JCM 3599 / NBRC 0793 / NRRL Y-1031 F-60-10) TaxID=1206466 RepID=K0KSF6_WICCF|nr:uncharacterized protein BN7_4539 [Wickerhamomyces ciferrii]CCH44962.1 putative membrane protein [Wickerhamomyces ciferrii]